MSSNTIGRLFSLTTFGESHGPAIGGIVDGCPSNIELSEADIQPDLDRRRPGSSRFTSQRREDDRVEILSGVFEGKTTGTPIALLIRNTDQRSRDYSKIADRYRPGHADYTYQRKYGIRDYRGGGRASARETVARVAAGAVAKKYLAEQFGTQIRGFVSAIGYKRPGVHDWNEVENNPFFWPDSNQIGEIEEYINELRSAGDSIGALITVEANSVPSGWGEPIYNKLDAEIASAMMGINAVKGVEIGSGFSSAGMRGSEYRDEMSMRGFLSNNAGGIVGGISSGQPVVVHVAFKPTSSILKAGATVNKFGEDVEVSVTGRHDPCVGLRAVPIVEAMLALVLMDMALIQRAKHTDFDLDGPEIPGAIVNLDDEIDMDLDQTSFEASGED